MTGYESKRAAAQDKLVVTDIDGHVVRDARKPKKAQPAAPEVWMFQHDETGRVTCILNDGINTPELFLEMNPRYALIGSPNSLKRPWVMQREWVDLTEDEIDKWAHELHGVIYAVMAELKEKNNG